MSALALSALFLSNTAIAAPTPVDCPSLSAAVEGSRLTVTPDARTGSMGLKRAWDCISSAIADRIDIRDVVVRLPAGRQALDAPLVWPAARGRPVTVTVSGAGAEISGTRLLDKWQPAGGNVPGSDQRWPPGVLEVAIPPEAAAAMRQGLTRDQASFPTLAPPELVVDGELFHLARWPRSGFLTVDTANQSQSTLTAASIDPLPLRSGPVQAQGFWFHDWADSARPARADTGSQGRQLTLALAGSWPKYGVKSGGRFLLLGAPAFIGSPGDYAVLPDRDAIAFMPRRAPTQIELTATDSAFQIAGATGFTLDGVTVEGFRGVAVNLSGQGVWLRNCHVRHAGVVAVRLSGTDGGIEKCTIDGAGATAVELRGGDRRSLAPGKLTLADSEVSNFGRLVWSSVPGVRVDGVGNTVTRNRIHGGPHSGIFYFGNDHEISDNEVYEVARMTGDVGAIYTGRDWAGRGHKVLRNYVHDVAGFGVHGATAIYIDDQSSGVEVRDNIVWRVDRGVLVGGGRDNIVQRNLFVKVRECLKLDDRGLNWQRGFAQPGGELNKRLNDVPFDSPLFKQRYPGLASVKDDRPGVPVGNIVRENLGIDCNWTIAPEAAKAGTVERNQTLADLPFADPRAIAGPTAPKRDAFRLDWQRVLSTLH